MTYLLDTHALIWTLEFPHMLSETARSLIRREENRMMVSSMSAFEIATKVRIGKLPQAEVLHATYQQSLLLAGIGTLKVDDAIALRAGRLDAAHRDPFDRLIAATAIAADIPIISVDTAFDGLQVRRIW